MNILFLSPDTPFPPNTGGRARTYNLIRECAQAHTVSIICIGTEPEELIAQHSGFLARVQQIHWQPWGLRSAAEKVWFSCLALLRRTTPEVVWLPERALLAAIESALKMQSVDLLVIESSYLVPLVKVLKGRHPALKVILNSQNVEYQLLQRIGATAKNPFIAWQKKLLWRNLRRIERQLLGVIDHIIAVSELDEVSWRALNPGVPVSIVPNGVDTDNFQPYEGEMDTSIVFCGAMSYRPNEEGILWFCQEIWPLITGRLTGTKLVIVGKDPGSAVRSLSADPRIMVTGMVPDVRPYVQRARLVIVPLLSGGGTRLKVLEAMALGKLVVSTTIGAEGIARSPGVILADQPQAFADRLVEAYEDDVVPFGRANRRIIEEHYSWRAIGRMLVEVFSEVHRG